jgi:hypothetical protein
MREKDKINTKKLLKHHFLGIKKRLLEEIEVPGSFGYSSRRLNFAFEATKQYSKLFYRCRFDGLFNRIG